MKKGDPNPMNLVIGIDASRNRSGGAIAHLVGILNEEGPERFGVRKVHVWAPSALLSAVHDKAWLVKHSPQALQHSLVSQIFWQATRMKREAQIVGCDVLFTTDASTFCRFSPMIVLSQDMLSYEPGIMKLFGFGMQRLRLQIILLLQNRAFRFADGVIFLTHYAATLVQKSCGPLKRIAYIPHGIGSNFKREKIYNDWPINDERAIRCLYVSNADRYKHQWVVVRAVALLRDRGYNLTLTLVGGGGGLGQYLLDEQIILSDPKGEFVEQLDFLPQSDIPRYLGSADLFVFASSCENLPITLLEAMAVGLPIACSNRGPMQEVLADGGIYFNPEDADTIAEAIEQIIQSPALRLAIAQRAKTLSQQYSWKRCADETFSFIAETYLRTKT